jgi:phosphoenolpyruvate carboxylase
LQELARRLSLSAERLPAPPELSAWIDARRPLPQHVAFIEERYPTEPYRLVLSLLANDLAEASRDDMAARLLERTPHQARINLQELIQPVNMIASSLPPVLAQDEIQNVQRQLNIFGLHSMRLDLRED